MRSPYSLGIESFFIMWSADQTKQRQDVVSVLLKMFIIAVLSFHLKISLFLVDLILQRPWDFHSPLSYRSHMEIMMTWPAQKTLWKKKNQGHDCV